MTWYLNSFRLLVMTIHPAKFCRPLDQAFSKFQLDKLFVSKVKMALDPISIICRILDITTSLPSVIYWSWPTTLPNKRTVCPSVLQLSSRRHICVKCQRGIWPETLIWVVYNSRPTSLPSLMTVCLSVLQLSFKHTFVLGIILTIDLMTVILIDVVSLSWPTSLSSLRTVGPVVLQLAIAHILC